MPSVFHCYTDSIENAKKVLDLGHYISFSGVVTFKKSFDLLDVVRYVPEDRFLIETDCPYLAPVPYRGKSNEPAFVSLVAKCIAEVRETSVERISQVTTDNFFNLFQKAKFLRKEKCSAT
jgi:TatD DNase family protein